MSIELLAVLDNLEREKGIPRQILVESVEAALASAAKKVLHDKEVDVQVKIDLKTGKISMFSDGKEIMSQEFGRIAAQTAKQVIFQKIREAERNVVYGEFIKKLNQTVSGTVYRFEKGALLVDLGKTEALLPKREMSPRDGYRQGDTIHAYVLEVNNTVKGPQIILSRSHPNFVKCLFELEVPEIADGLVEIRSVSREAGDRTKIAVWSKNEKIDCVGACVGIRGSRVKGVVKELQGEKIDIIRWSDNVEEFVRAALSPAEVSSVRITNEADRKVEVVVDDEQLSLAIGKSGQNVRLASKLTGWSIDIRSKKDLVKEKLEVDILGEAPAPAEGAAPAVLADAPVDSLEGVGPKTLEALKEAGYATVGALRTAAAEDLRKVKGIGAKTLEKIFLAIGRGAELSAPEETKPEAPAEGEGA